MCRSLNRYNVFLGKLRGGWHSAILTSSFFLWVRKTHTHNFCGELRSLEPLTFRAGVHCYCSLDIVFSASPVRRSQELRGDPHSNPPPNFVPRVSHLGAPWSSLQGAVRWETLGKSLVKLTRSVAFSTFQTENTDTRLTEVKKIYELKLETKITRNASVTELQLWTFYEL